VGYPTIHVLENDTGPDDCNHAQHGAFILASSNNPLRGPIEGRTSWTSPRRSWSWAVTTSHPSMQGRSLVAGLDLAEPAGVGYSSDEEATVRDRLSGLGYIS
jgi:hypothetical protein